MPKDKLLIKGVNVRLYGERSFSVRDILIEKDGGVNRIRAVSPVIEADGVQKFDAFGMTAFPSFVDLWARMGEPDGDKRETFSTGSNAAVNGGYGVIVAAPFGKPSTDDPDVLRKRIDAASSASRCSVMICSSLSYGNAGKKLCDYQAMKDAGAVAFSDGEYERLPDDLLREAMIRISAIDGLFIAVPRIQACYGDASVNLGRVSKLTGLKGAPYSAEVADILRYLAYASETGCRLHIAGVSTEQGITVISEARRLGMDITASAFPFSFTFTEDDIFFYGSMAKVWPPLRTRKDALAVRDALADGVIDCVSSCHTPLTDREKTDDIASSSFGSTGIQTAFSAACTYLFSGDSIDPALIYRLFCGSPSDIIGLNDRSVKIGDPADLCIVSFDRDFIVSENYLKSRSSNSVFKGLSLRGSVEKVVLPHSAL